MDRPPAAKPESDDFTDELIEKIEILTSEKSELVKELQDSKEVQLRLQKDLEQLSSRRSSVVVEAPILSPIQENHKKCEAEKNQLASKIS